MTEKVTHGGRRAGADSRRHRREGDDQKQLGDEKHGKDERVAEDEGQRTWTRHNRQGNEPGRPEPEAHEQVNPLQEGPRRLRAQGAEAGSRRTYTRLTGSYPCHGVVFTTTFVRVLSRAGKMLFDPVRVCALATSGRQSRTATGFSTMLR
jgi:hypothetical protein